MQGKRVVLLMAASQLAVLLALGGAAVVFRSEIGAWLAAAPQTPVGVVDPLTLDATDVLVTDAIARANPAVVSVIVSKDVPILERYYEEFGFGFVIPRVRERGTELREVGGGSGFIVSPEGLVVTNRHVVADEAATYSILTNDGESRQVRVVARDAVFDIAVLEIVGGGTYPHLTFGNSDGLVLGQRVIAIGNALAEFRNSVSVGVVSGLARSIVAGDAYGTYEALDAVIQTDAAINPGNSGGPLLDLAGQVIGVNVATALGSENISFALPGNIVADIVDSIREHGRIVRPSMGVRYVMLTDRVAEEFPVDYGALVIQGAGGEPAVLPGSPASRAGIRAGDIILSIGGEDLRGTRTLAQAVRNRHVGEEVTVHVLRGSEEFSVALVLEEAAGE